jgi:hypothetical protein
LNCVAPDSNDLKRVDLGEMLIYTNRRVASSETNLLLKKGNRYILNDLLIYDYSYMC